jgi:hypothetical protein
LREKRDFFLVPFPRRFSISSKFSVLARRTIPTTRSP